MADPSGVSEAALEHARRYFELHASQRMSLFNFFLVLAGLFSAGLAAVLQGSENLSILGMVLGVLLSLVSFVFWKLDQRVSFFIKHAEAALSELEKRMPEERARLFLNEPALTSVARSTGPRWTRMWTYSRSFRVVFLTMAATGFGGFILSVLRICGCVKW